MIHLHIFRSWRVVPTSTVCDDGLRRRFEVALCRCGESKHRVSDVIVDRSGATR
jgi:CDGSH-type Zn-finger protein